MLSFIAQVVTVDVKLYWTASKDIYVSLTVLYFSKHANDLKLLIILTILTSIEILICTLSINNLK